MKRLYFLVFITFCLNSSLYAGNGLKSYSYLPKHISDDGMSISRFNIKIQPAVFWATLGLEAEYVVSPKFTLALNILGKLGETDAKNNFRPIKKQDFLENGYLAELTGRCYIQLTKKKIALAPTGFYIQATVGYSKLLYFDGNTRPFTLHTRKRNINDPNFKNPTPIIGSLGAGYQVELVPKKIIANLSILSQTNIDDRGFFLSIYISPSIGILF